nr:odorant receptor [Semanotus bifasciatus]
MIILRRHIINMIQKRIDLQQAFSAEKMQMAVGKFYPSKTSRGALLYTIISIASISITIIQLSSSIIFIYLNIHVFDRFSEVFLFIMTQFATICKLVNFVSHKKEILELELILEHPLFTTVSAEEEKILKRSLKNLRVVTTVYKFLSVLAVSLYGICPLIDSDEKTPKYPLPGWFPFNADDYYWEVYIFEAVEISICAWFNSGLDQLLVIMMALGEAQFEVLKYRLTNVAANMNEDAMNEDLVQERLKKCIIHHELIIRFVALTNSIFSKGTLVQFMSSVVVICLTGFQMVIISIRSVQFVERIAFFYGMMVQISMYCWYGHALMDSSEKLTEACYMADWTRCSLKVKKSLLIIMERTKISTMVKAGNIFPLNLPTLLTIFRSTYSCFTVIYRLYSENDIQVK